MKPILFAAALSLVATTAAAEPEAYTLDPSHSQVLFSYNHLGYSTTWGMFSGFEGKISFDADVPEASSVEVSMPVTSMLTGWEDRFKHFMSPEFFGATDDEMITFVSTGIEVTGENTALITGDLTLNGVTKEVVLDTKLNQAGMHPMANTPWAGFDATTQLVRSDYNLGMFAPYVSDEVELKISVEAQKATGSDES
ncbi:MAG: YceI family protein [Sedimentitalea sp.]|uniref:YceI family protein n=1 Tax=Sedimentitalea sp. TaxID=2048915 RepID=UPI0032675750